MRRVVIIGVNGQLGSDLRELLAKKPESYEVVGLDLPDFDVREHARVRERLRELAPQLVVNMAAFHRVDDCEDEPQLAFEVNALAVLNLARVCRELDAPLMHFSTDYVFGAERDRRTPYTETDATGPVSVYGASKLAGEHLVRASWRKHFVVRTCGLYGRSQSSTKGGNFVEVMLRLARERKPLKVVDDQHLAPTSTFDLAPELEALLGTDAFGLYHLTAAGECTWYDFARAIFELTGQEPELAPTTTEAFGAKADRPRYSVLDNKAARAIGLAPLCPWREGLAEYLRLTGRCGSSGHGVPALSGTTKEGR
jgi:dTDP-4-dehydrorhamnose reductase